MPACSCLSLPFPAGKVAAGGLHTEEEAAETLANLALRAWKLAVSWLQGTVFLLRFHGLSS
eukprot:SAG22_NODE_175_length_16235_cov_67.112729_17_plen_61_part_00